MHGAALVQLAMEKTGLNQKGLGEHLGVSPTQVSKWKRGDYMSADMRRQLSALADIGTLHPEFVAMSGSLGAARKWERIIRNLAESAYEGAETGYNTQPLSEDNDNLPWETFEVLSRMGVVIPKEFPPSLEFILVGDENEERDYDAETVALEEHPITAIISSLFSAMNDVYGFHVAYIDELSYRSELEFEDGVDEDVRAHLLWLSATKVAVDPTIAPEALRFALEVKGNYETWLRRMKEMAYQAGTPLRAELMNLVYEDTESLGHEAEAESLGFTAHGIHPDIYMNELLVGMRVIHQVLPAILKKLGIDDEFKLDQTELRLGD